MGCVQYLPSLSARFDSPTQHKCSHLIVGTEKAVGDSAYQGEPNFVVPIKKARARELKRSEKLFNKQVSHVRVAVENVFKRIKDYHTISDIYRGDYHKLADFNIIFRLVCAIVNIHFQRHPLRQSLRTLKQLPTAV